MNECNLIPQRASGTDAQHQQYLETTFYLPPLGFGLLQEPEREHALFKNLSGTLFLKMTKKK